MHIRTVLNKTLFGCALNLCPYSWLVVEKGRSATALLGETPAKLHVPITCQATHIPVTCQAAHISIVGQLAKHRDVPQAQPHAPGRLPPCFCSFSGCKTSSHCLHQQVQTDPWNPQSVLWLIDSRRNVLLSFFLLPCFFIQRYFIHGREESFWTGLGWELQLWQSIFYDLFLNKYFWDLICTALFFTPVRNIWSLSKILEEWGYMGQLLKAAPLTLAQN